MAMGWTNAVPGQAPDDFDLFRRYGESYARVADVDSGELEGMVAVGDEVDAAGIRVQLVFLELRTNGGIATLATHTRPPVAVPGHFVDVAVRDEAGTQFTAAGQSIGGNTPSTARFEVRFAPAPSGSTLTIHIERFVGPFPGDRSTIDGPWTVVIPLGK